MDEGSLGVHEIELVVESGEDLSDGGRVRDHADSSEDLSEVSSWDDGGWLVVDTTLEAGWAPVDELNGSLGLDGGHGSVDVFGDDITSVHQRTGHVLAVSWVALSHHGSGLEDGVGDFANGELLVVGLLGGDDWSVRRKHEMDSWVWHQVGLELIDVDVQSTIESERHSQRRDDLRDQSVQVGVGGSLDVEVSSADVVDGLVVQHDGDVSVLEERVSREDGVVWFNDSSGDLRGWVDGETEFGFLAVVHGESLEEERGESGTSTTTDGVGDDEALETSAAISQFSDSVEAEVDDFSADGVVSSGEVVRGIFLSGDDLLWVEQLSVGSGSDFVDDGWFKVDEESSRHVLAGTGLAEECVEGIIGLSEALVRWHLPVWLDAVFKAEQLPTGVGHLNTSLSDVNGNDFSHLCL